MKTNTSILILAFFVCYACTTKKVDETNHSYYPGHLFEYSENIEPRWSSFENLNGIKGQGGMENNGGKGHSHDMIKAGEHKVLLETSGPGIINRIWVTLRDRSPYALRGLVLNMYWDHAEKPAVSVPFGDFFGVGLGETAIFENALFANPEGRSFNGFVQMPFRKAARIEVVNEMDTDIQLVFFDIDFQQLKKWDENFMYFHAYWHRDTATTLAEDFKILPEIKGKGRFIGSNVGVIANPDYNDYWFGEGEAKVFLDGDTAYPTLAGTGTEDYIGTAWGQGKFQTNYSGCLIADSEYQRWSFYRYHIIDPIYFHNDCQVTLQQMGGTSKKNVIAMQQNGVKLIPVTISRADASLIHIYHKDSTVDLENPIFPDENAWTNFYRSDDVSAVAYFYLDNPKNDLPPIQDLGMRTFELKKD